MTSIRCNYAPLAELPVDDPAAARWLSPAERRAWDRLRDAERRATWLAGRILAKRMLIARLAETNNFGLPEPAEIHIETRSSDGTHGERPRVFIGGRPLDWALSIAHTSRGALAALGCEPRVTLGVDLVCRQTGGNRLQWTFTAAERRWLASTGRHSEQVWAMKEALYKACQQGEGFVPGQIEVVPEVCYPALGPGRIVRRVQGWRVDGHFAALAVVEAAHTVVTTSLEETPPHAVRSANRPIPRGDREWETAA